MDKLRMIRFGPHTLYFGRWLCTLLFSIISMRRARTFDISTRMLDTHLGDHGPIAKGNNAFQRRRHQWLLAAKVVEQEAQAPWTTRIGVCISSNACGRTHHFW